MPTLAEIRQRMLQLDPSLGRVESIASLTATTIVVNALAVGTVQSGKFKEKWLLRPEAASAADRLRFCSNYASDTGTLSHAGTNYADTDEAGEVVEIHEYEPYLIDQAIVRAMRASRFLDRYILPLNQSGTYWLDDLDWITDPANLRIGYTSSPVITNNRHFEQWNGYSSGSLIPDYWTLGANATFSRSTTARRGAYSLQIITSGETTVSVVIRAVPSGVDDDSLRGLTVTGFAVSKCTTASSQRVRVQSEKADGTLIGSAVNSGYHDGDDQWQELSVEHTVEDTADQVELQFRQEQNETGQLDELGLMIGSLDDSVRRDQYRIVWYDHTPRWRQGQPLRVDSFVGQVGQLVVESPRPYEPFTASRVTAGTADADETDAPLDMVAYGALAKFYESHPHSTTETAIKAAQYRDQFGWMQQLHLAQSQDEQGTRPGANLLGRATPVGARVR